MTHQDAVLKVLNKFKGGLSDYGILHAVQALRPDVRPTPSSIRTRRKELTDLGMVKDSGKTERSSTGRSAIVWKVA